MGFDRSGHVKSGLEQLLLRQLAAAIVMVIVITVSLSTGRGVNRCKSSPVSVWLAALCWWLSSDILVDQA